LFDFIVGISVRHVVMINLHLFDSRCRCNINFWPLWKFGHFFNVENFKIELSQASSTIC